MKPASRSSVPARVDAWLAVPMIIAILVVYSRAFGAGFIWDDDAHLTANACIVGPDGLKEVWTSAAANYFPLVLTHLWVLHALWGLAPLPYHVANVLLHAMAAIVLWRVLRDLELPSPWLAALVWAVHPVQVESVAWISEMKNTQSGLFYLLAIASYVRWLKMDGAARFTRRYAAALICAVLALLSKPSTVMLPVALGLCAWWLRRAWRWKDIVGLIPFFVLSLIVSGWTIWEQKFHSGALGPEWNLAPLARVMVAGRAIWFYLAKLFWPADLAYIYPRWQFHATSVDGWLALAGIILVAAVVVRYRRSAWARATIFGFGYFVALLFPVLGFFDVYFFRYSYVADHFQYLASIGPLVCALAGLQAVAKKFPAARPSLLAVGAPAVVTVLGILSFRQTRIYADEHTLWQRTVVQNPACWLARLRLGMMAVDAGQTGEALTQLAEAQRMRPDDPDVTINLGNALLQANRVPEAIQTFERALRLSPASAEAYCDLGNAYMQTNRAAEALQCYETALRLNPKFAIAAMNLGSALFGAGRVAEAIPHYETAVRLKPNYAEAHSNLGSALLQIGRANEAIPQYETALSLKPNYVDAESNLAMALLRVGRTSTAIEHLQHVVALAPNHLTARCQLGLTFAAIGQNAAAIEHLTAALQLQPNLPEVQATLAQLRGAPPTARPSK